MHNYGRPGEKHIVLLGALGAIGVALAYSLEVAFHALSWRPPFWFDVPATLGILALLYKGFDIWLWKLVPASTWLSDTLTDYSGAYEGKVKSSHDNGALIDCKLSIKQTYGRILLVLTTAGSRSQSIAGSIIYEFDKMRLHYLFENKPNQMATESMHAHDGTATIEFQDKDTLYIEYYTGRDRQTQGEGTLKRVAAKKEK